MTNDGVACLAATFFSLSPASEPAEKVASGDLGT